MDSITPCTASSLSTVNMPRIRAAPSTATRSALSGLSSQAPAFWAIRAESSFARTTSSDRKFSSTNCPSDSPIWSFLRGMIAVCGILSPIGCLKRAVTANQSARAPTMPPSAAARTYSSHGYVSCRAKATRKMAAITASSPVASSFMRRRASARSASAPVI